MDLLKIKLETFSQLKRQKISFLKIQFTIEIDSAALRGYETNQQYCISIFGAWDMKTTHYMSV